MSNTISIKIYSFSKAKDVSDFINELLNEKDYSEFELRPEFQQQNGIKVQAFQKRRESPPDWFRALRDYIVDRSLFSGFKSYNFIGIIHVNESNFGPFIITGGFAHAQISNYIDHEFGISILERIFDPDKNKIDSVSEKGIIGDVLASSRYYRRARALAYEDEFGKFFQRINISLTASQIAEFFGSLNQSKSRRNRSEISVSGASAIEIKTKVSLIGLVNVIKDLCNVLSLEPQNIFNQNLLPLSKRKHAQKVEYLENKLIERLVNQENITEDIDFCHRDFEDFFRSTHCIVAIYHGDGGSKKYDSLNSLRNGKFLDDTMKILSNLPEIKTEVDKTHILKEYFAGLKISTFDENNKVLTEGNILEYIQAEIFLSDSSYFYIDGQWYQLKENFDKALNDRFKERVTPKIKKFSFVKPWNNSADETRYNEKYNSGTLNSLYLHLLKPNYVELADLLWFDAKAQRLYITHVKKGLNALMRDLASQIFLSARIIESEIKSSNKPYLKDLFRSAKRNGRIDKSVSLQNFLDMFQNNERVYLLIIREEKDTSDIKLASFRSRIAKFTLSDLSGAMSAFEWPLMVSII